VELGRGQTQLTEAVVTPPPPAPTPVETPKVTPAPVPVVAADVRDWEPLKDSRDVSALEGYRRKYPSSPFAEQAGRRLDDIRKQQADLARKQQEQADAAARVKAEAEKAQESQAVRGAIDRYAKGYDAKDVDTLRSVWPGMPSQTQTTLRRTFREAKSISLKLTPQSVEVNGNSAVAVCARELRQMLDRPLDDRVYPVTIRKAFQMPLKADPRGRSNFPGERSQCGSA
jgi:hypothetical protein